jgi:CRISPR-associated protein, Csx3 family
MTKPVFLTRDANGIRVVSFEIPGGVTTPSEFSESIAELGELSGKSPIIFDGRGPVWGYGMLIHAAHPTPWVAVRDPRLGAVVIATHSPDQWVGNVIPFP